LDEPPSLMPRTPVGRETALLQRAVFYHAGRISV